MEKGSCSMKKIELLSPAGDYKSLEMAIDAGADAVYVSLKSYGARAFAPNFTMDEIKSAIKLCHLYGVRLYVTMNTLVKDTEVDDFLEKVKFLYLEGVDALIMQDLGMICLVRQMYPDLEIHASTQFNNSSKDTLILLKKLGVKRAVLSRELSIDEIKMMDVDIEKEIFIHGALCVSYSGCCLFSSMIGHRSGNRGECTGCCRLPYKLETNGKIVNSGYLLSMKELNTNPGEIASTAGTSGVVYGVNGEVNYDPKSRVNTFAHVNHTAEQTRLGVLLCINGTGILNSWVKRTVAPEGISYSDMNVLAAQAPIGSAGISILPFGNGAERMLENRETGCSIQGVNFNQHGKQHIIRAAQEGIVFSFKYGIDIMEQMGIPVQKIHAGKANMFLSPLFRETLAGVTGAVIELYDTDGSVGAAKGAGIGAGIYKDNNEAFATLEKLEIIEPGQTDRQAYADAYARWKHYLMQSLRPA